MIESVALIFLLALNQVQAIRYLGRVNPTTKELTWPGTGVSFTFTGTTANIAISQVNGGNSANLYIDDEEPIIISNVQGTSISTPVLPFGKHTVVLRRRSETVFGTFSLGAITTDGRFGSDNVPSRRIEFIGDSITVGYGLDGVNPCTNNAAVTNNPETYGALAAESLDADYTMVAWSGIGLTRNYASTQPDPSDIMPERYTRYGANDPLGSYPFPSSAIPQAVVIGLGTNDFSYQGVRDPLNGTLFGEAMTGFVRHIQGYYPNAEIFLVTSPMLSDDWPAGDRQKSTQREALLSAAKTIGTKAHVVEWPTQGSSVGCDYHPNGATHAAEALVLAEAIRSVLGW